MAAPDPRIREVFDRAIDLPVADRPGFVAEACAGDDHLRSRVESLLAALDRAGTHATLDQPMIPGRSGPETPGSIIDGRYRLESVLGQGGFGTVFEAHQLEPVDRVVALKLIRSGMDSDRVLARFEMERQTLARMDHPGIARIFDAGTTDSGRPYFAMERVQGLPILEYCDQARLSITDRIRLFIDVLRAVQHAHQKGIIHRDLKPSNILVTTQDEVATAKVIDFGIAKAMHTEVGDPGLTQEHQFVGTPRYMSPEQLAGSPDVDTRSDVYALGVVLYELLSGVVPLAPELDSHAPFPELARRLQEEPLRPSTRLHRIERARDDSSESRLAETAASRGLLPRQLIRRLAGDLDWIVMAALARSPEERYATVADLAQDLEHHLADEPVSAGPPGGMYRFRKFARRHRGALAATALVLLVLVGGVVGTAIGLVHATQQTEIAEAINEFFNTDLLAAIEPSEEMGRGREVALREVLDVTAARIDHACLPGGRFANKPLVAAEIRRTVGRAFLQLGEYDRSLRQLEGAHVLLERKLGPEDRRTLDCLEHLAALRHARGELDIGMTLAQQVLASRRRVFGDDADTVASLDQVAMFLHRTGRSKEAREVIEEARSMSSRVLDPEAQLSLRVECNSGLILRDLHETEEALRRLEHAFDARSRILGDDHPQTLSSAVGLARMHSTLGRFPESEALYRRVLEIRERLLGADHPETLLTCHNLGVVLKQESRFPDAEQMIARALEGRNKFFGAGHPTSLNTRGQLVTILRRLGRLDEAERVCREGIALSEGAELRDERLELSLKSALAGVLRARRESPDEALELRREIYQGLDRILGSTHRDTLNAQGNLAAQLTELDRHEECLALLEDLLAFQLSHQGADSLEVAVTRNNMALSLKQIGDFERAVELASLALETRRARLGEGHRDTLSSCRMLAGIQLKRGELEAADLLLREAVPLAVESLGSRSPVTTDLRGLQVETLWAGGRYEPMVPAAEDLLTSSVELFGEGHPMVVRAREMLLEALDKTAEIQSTAGRSDEATATRNRAAEVRRALPQGASGDGEGAG